MPDYRLQFDGYKLRLLDGQKLIKSWDAVSGMPGYQSPVFENEKDKGPIPTGVWSFNTSKIQTISVQDDIVGTVSGGFHTLTGYGRLGKWFGGRFAWGLERVFLKNEGDADKAERSGFSIHGGDRYGSAGCIDLGHKEVDFFRTLTKLRIKAINLHVEYDPTLYMAPHPLAGRLLNPFSRGPFPNDHRGNRIPILRGVSTIATPAKKFTELFGHPFNGSDADIGLMLDAIADGKLPFKADYVEASGKDRYTAPFYTESGDRIVISADSTTWFASTMRNGEMERIIKVNADGSRIALPFDPGDAQTWPQHSTDWNATATEPRQINDPAAGFDSRAMDLSNKNRAVSNDSVTEMHSVAHNVSSEPFAGYDRNELTATEPRPSASQPASTIISAANRSNSDRIHELHCLMADRYSEYWKGPKADTLQQEFRDLIEVPDSDKIRGSKFSLDPEGSRTPIPSSINADEQVDSEDKAVTDRMAEIQGLMADRYSEYWTGPKADALQQEYRDLIERRDRSKMHGRSLSPFTVEP